MGATEPTAAYGIRHTGTGHLLAHRAIGAPGMPSDAFLNPARVPRIFTHARHARQWRTRFCGADQGYTGEGRMTLGRTDPDVLEVVVLDITVREGGL